MDPIIAAIERTRELLLDSGVDEGHGIKHVTKVLSHVRRVIEECGIHGDACTSVIIAAVLHDVDDRKFFPKSKDYDNARAIVKDTVPHLEDDIIRMVSLVSCSTNGDTTPDDVPGYFLIPRYCDRLEAIGSIGIERCLIYSKMIGHPMKTEDTLIARTEEELWKIATPERYSSYNGCSVSILDHMYDKVLHVLREPTGYKYIDDLAKKRRKVIVEFCINTL